VTRGLGLPLYYWHGASGAPFYDKNERERGVFCTPFFWGPFFYRALEICRSPKSEPLEIGALRKRSPTSGKTESTSKKSATPAKKSKSPVSDINERASKKPITLAKNKCGLEGPAPTPRLILANIAHREALGEIGEARSENRRCPVRSARSWSESDASRALLGDLCKCVPAAAPRPALLLCAAPTVQHRSLTRSTLLHCSPAGLAVTAGSAVGAPSRHEGTQGQAAWAAAGARRIGRPMQVRMSLAQPLPAHNPAFPVGAVVAVQTPVAGLLAVLPRSPTRWWA